MATKTPVTEVAIIKPLDVTTLPADMMAALAAEAKEAAASERPAVSKLSTANGQLKYMGDPVAGNNMDVMILYASYRRVWYSGAYDPNNIKNPDCFALAETDEDMIPGASNPVNPTCNGCPKNEWKSDVQNGVVRKGKACKESRRMIMMTAAMFNDPSLDPSALPDAIKKAELAILDLPVTSAKNYGGFVNTVAAMVNVPPWAVIANVKVQPSKNQFEVILTPLRVLPGAAVVMAVKSRLEDAKRLALEPYDETSPTNSAVIQAQRSAEAAASQKF